MSASYLGAPPNGGPWQPAQFGANIVGAGATHTLTNTSNGLWLVTDLDVAEPALLTIDIVAAVMTVGIDPVTIWSDQFTPGGIGESVYMSWRGLLVLDTNGQVTIQNHSIATSFGYSLSGFFSADSRYLGPDVVIGA